MEQALQLWKAFDSWADVQEREVASFLAPDFDYDARATKGWFGTKLSHALAAVAVYGVLVIIGMIRYQKVEKTKEKASSVVAAFQQEPIRFLQVIYNAAQVGLCGWMMVAAFVSAREQGYSLVCNKFDPSSTRMASIEWVFYLSKVLDFMDTFFIVYRGSWSQFSFLHIYHHTSIFLTYWAITLIGADGDIYFTIVANSFIHFLMYFYYLCTCFNIRPSWGKNLTQLQMIQFLAMNAQAIYILVNDCPYPRRVIIFYLIYIISLFALFMQFYLQRWNADAASKKAAKGVAVTASAAAAPDSKRGDSGKKGKKQA